MESPRLDRLARLDCLACLAPSGPTGTVWRESHGKPLITNVMCHSIRSESDRIGLVHDIFGGGHLSSSLSLFSLSLAPALEQLAFKNFFLQAKVAQAQLGQ